MSNSISELAQAAESGTHSGGHVSYNFLESFWEYFQADAISSIPITICSVLVIATIIERSIFYTRNNCDITYVLHNLQIQLEKGDIDSARSIATQTRSVIGEVAEEGIRLLAVQKEDFSKAYDITTAIVTRRLEKYLTILGTIATICPFLGLFGTVSGVIKALYSMSLGGAGGTNQLVGEISNALIATGYGLAVAIMAVVLNSIFSNIVKRFQDDFMLLKLLFLSFSDLNFHDGNDDYYGGQETASDDDFNFDGDDDSNYPDFMS